MADLPLTRGELISAMRMSLADGGWPAESAETVIDDNLAIASAYPAGTVIEREFDKFRARTAYKRRLTQIHQYLVDQPH